eukprot:1157163-Pelagomonas_calceolata.AAC.4
MGPMSCKARAHAMASCHQWGQRAAKQERMPWCHAMVPKAYVINRACELQSKSACDGVQGLTSSMRPMSSKARAHAMMWEA